MKVLYITHARDLTGANSSLLQMVTELREYHNIEPFVVYPDRKPNGQKTIKDALKERNISGAACGRMVCFQREHVGFIYKIYFILSDIINIIQILWAIRGHKFDLVHTNTSILDLGLYISKILRIPHVWHLREVGWLSFNYRSIFGPSYMKWVYGNSTKMIAISNNVQKEFTPYIPLDKTVRIYNGVFPPAGIKVPDHSCDSYKICIVGRVEENKNQMEAVKAVQQLVEKGINRFRLYIIGGYNNLYGEKVIKYVEDNNLSQYVVFMGLRNDVHEILNDMNIGLMLSRHEAFGRVTVEYMLHSLFVIASNTSANLEIVKDGSNGFLYSFGDSSDLAKKIEYILNRRLQIEAVAKAGYEDAIHNYTSKANSDNVYKLYEEILVKSKE